MQRTLLASIALLTTLTVSIPGRIEAQSGRWGKDYFPNLPVVTQDGKTLQFYNDVIKGKIVVMSFIYTSCKDICPITTSRLAQIEEKLGDRVGRDIFINSISVDPENDTPGRMAGFSGLASEFTNAAPWHFVTTRTQAELLPILRAYGQAVDKKQNPFDITGPLNHTLRVYLIDAGGIHRRGAPDPT